MDWDEILNYNIASIQKQLDRLKKTKNEEVALRVELNNLKVCVKMLEDAIDQMRW